VTRASAEADAAGFLACTCTNAGAIAVLPRLAALPRARAAAIVVSGGRAA
jgi:hypothetical protein